MSQTLTQETLATIHNIYNLPENSRAELIDGQIYDMAPLSRKHQTIFLFTTLNQKTPETIPFRIL